MTITAILVSHNSAHVIEAALRCICNHPKIAECIVVDNASQDLTVETIHSKFPTVRVVQNTENLGFGTACNQALEQTASEIALLMNPDVVIDSDGIDKLLEGFRQYPEAAVIAPALRGHGKCLSPWQPGPRNDKAEGLTQPGGKASAVTFISGAIAMWRMSYMRRVGFFDPAFFLFYEDDDISLRVRNAGYDLIVISGVNVKHTPGKSCLLTEETESIKLRSTVWSYLYIIRKHRGRAKAWMAAISLTLRKALSASTHNERYHRKQKQLLAAALKEPERQWHAARERLREQLLSAEQQHKRQLTAETTRLEVQCIAEEKALDGSWRKAAEEHEKRLKARKQEFGEQWEAVLRENEDAREKNIKMREAEWAGILKESESNWAVLVEAHEQRQAAMEKECDALWKEAAEAHEARLAARSQEFEKAWQTVPEKSKEAIKEHEARWAEITKEFERKWIGLAAEHGKRRKEELDALWEKAVEEHEKQLTAGRQELEEKWQAVMERAMQENIRSHEMQWTGVMKEFEKSWTALVEKHEAKRRETAWKYEQLHAAMNKKFQKQWAAITADHEEKLDSATAQYEQQRLAAVRENPLYLAAVKKKESADICRAIWHFLCSPRRFRYNG